jgi:hypothetical protein
MCFLQPLCLEPCSSSCRSNITKDRRSTSPSNSLDNTLTTHRRFNDRPETIDEFASPEYLTTMYSTRYIERNVSPTPSGPLKKPVKPNETVEPAPAIATQSGIGMEATVTTEHARATVSTPNPPAADNQEPSTSASASGIELMDVPGLPHTPSNAPRKARDDNHRSTYATAHQELFANLYDEFGKDFEQKGLPKTHATILKFAQERLAEQRKTLANQAEEMCEISDEITIGNEEIGRLNTVIAGLHRTTSRLSAKVEAMNAQIKGQSKFITAQDRIIPEQEYEIKEQATIIREGKHHIVQQWKRICEQERRIEFLEGLLMEHGWDKHWLEYAMMRMELGATAKEVIVAVEQAD